MKPKQITRWVLKGLLTVFLAAVMQNVTLGQPPLSGTYNIPGSYLNLAAAINDLNNYGVAAGGVTLNIAAGYTETAPAGGFVLGSAVLNPTLSSSSPLIIQKSGTGPNPLLIAFTGTTTNSDGIFKLNGADWVTIDGIDLTEDYVNNTTATQMMEWGYALVRSDGTDGCQNNTIKNCSITLSKTNFGAPGTAGSHGIFSAPVDITNAPITATTLAGTNSNNTIISNTISNCNTPIYMVGFAATSPFTLYDQGNTVGAAGLGNTVNNFGSSATSTLVAGMYFNHQNNLNVNYNTVDNAAGGGSGVITSNNCFGIEHDASSNNTITITNNNVTMTRASGAGGTTCIASFACIAGSTTGSVTINSNTVRAVSTNPLTGAITLINAANAVGATVSVQNNILSNTNINTTGVFQLISASNSSTNMNVSGNATSGTISNAAVTSNGFRGIISASSAPTTGTHIFNNNNLSNISLNVNSNPSFILVVQNGASLNNGPNVSMNGNTISNISNTGSGAIQGLNTLLGKNNTLNNNTVNGITNTLGAVTAIIGGNTNTVSQEITGNTVRNVSTSLTNAIALIGIHATGAVTTNIYKNKVFDCGITGGSNSVLYGIYYSGAATVSTTNIYNNLVGRLTGQCAFVNGITGIANGQTSTSTSNVINVYYNTVYMDNTNGGVTNCYYSANANGTLVMRNNILVNNSTGGTPYCFHRAGTSLTAVLAGYGAASNNNIFYPTSAAFVFFNTTTSTVTTYSLTQHQTNAAPRDNQSKSEVVPFLNTTTGTSADYLHINPTIPTQAESGGANIAGFTDDFDGDIRQGNTGYTGTGTAPDIGADEGEFTVLPPNDATVIQIYSLGKMAVGYTQGFQVQARVKNVGAGAIASLNVTMTVSGANTFTNTQTVTGLAPNAEQLVTFAGFSPTAVGSNTLTISVQPDDNNTNNSMSMPFSSTENLVSYKYDTPPVTSGVGFTGATGDFVGKFVSPNNFGNPDTINGFEVIFTGTGGLPFRVGVWGDAGGVPGTLIYETPQQTSVLGTFFISLPDVVVSGTYYVGIKQTGTTNIGFGYQVENPIRSNSFYYTSPTGGTIWTNFSPNANFRISATVQYKTPTPPNCAVLIAPANGGTACINGTTLTWASGGGGPTGYKVYFGTNATLVNNEDNSVLVQNSNATSYATGPLTNATYYWKVVAYNADGDATGCTSRSFTTNLISCYCPSTATNGNFEYIANVQSGTFSNPTGSSLYANYIGLGPINSVPASPGGTFNVTVTMPGNQVYNEDRIYIFCDFNQDGDWNDSGELCGNADVTIAGGNVYNISCTIGAGVLTGNTVLRIKLGDEVTPTAMNNNPCQATFTYGEVEDYLINFTCGVTANSNEPVCENETLLLDATYLGSSSPVSWTWSGPNGFTASVEDPSRPLMTLADAGTYTVTVTDAASCTATTTVTVNVAPLPSASASSNAPVCTGDVLTLGSLPNGMLFYEWSGPNGFVSFSQNPLVTNSASSIHAGTYTVTVTSSFLCSATDTVNVEVNPRPVPYIISQTNVSCNGGNDGEVVIGSSGAAPFFFAWFVNNVSYNDYDSTTTISNLSAQTFTVQVTDDNGCQSDPDLQVTITEPSALVANPSSNSPLCTTGTLNLTSNVSGGTPPYDYDWTGPNTFSSTAANPSVINPSTAYSGTYVVTVTDDNGCVTTASTSVTVIAAPTAAITGGGNLCLTQSGTVTLNFTGTGPWSGTVSDGVNTVSFGPTMSNSASVSVTPTLTGVRTYTVTALSDANCPSGTSSGSAVFTVSSAPPTSTVHFVNIPAAACQGTVALINTNVVSGQNIQYSWNTGSNSSAVLFSDSIGGPFVPGPFVSNSNSVYAQYGALGLNQSGYNICVQGINGCGTTNNKCNFTRGTVSVPAGITGSSVQCPGDTGVVYSVAAPLPAGVETFIWSFSDSAAIITPFDSLNSKVKINFPPTFTTGTLSVKAALSCLGSSVSPARTLAISRATAAPAVPTGPSKVCPGNSYNYSVAPVAGASTYNWTVPANASIIGGAGTNSITVKFDTIPINFVNGIISVNTTSVCGANSGTTSRTVSSMVPSTPGNISGRTTGVCNLIDNYQVPAVSGVTYNWSLPAGASGSSSSNIITVTFSNSFVSGTISVTGSAIGCPVQSAPRNLTVSGVPATPGSITTPVAPCNGGIGQFQTEEVFGATSYTWTVPANGTTIDTTNGQGTNQLDVIWGTGPGTVTVKANNACGSSGVRALYYTPPPCPSRLAAEEASEVNSLTVYPNPAHTQTTIAFKAPVQGSYAITLTDVSGRVVRSIVTTAEAGAHQVIIDLSDIAKGMYMVELRSDAGTEIQKLMVE